MRVEQTDIAGLSDNDVKLLVLSLVDSADRLGKPVIWRAFASALIGALKERRRLVFELDGEAINDDDIGALVDEYDAPTDGSDSAGSNGSGLQ